MNGQPLTADHGFPVRVVVPGWYGVQNVKWLNGLEVSPDRFMGRFQARDYVTIMGRQNGDKTEWVETSVTKIRTKSMIARVTQASQRRALGVRRGDDRRHAAQDRRSAARRRAVGRGEARGAAQSVRVDLVPRRAAGARGRARTRVASKATDALGRTQPANLD